MERQIRNNNIQQLFWKDAANLEFHANAAEPSSIAMNSIFTNGWGTFNGNLPDPATNLELQNPSRDGPELNEIFADRLISDTIAKEPLRWLQRFDGKTIISLFYLFANIPVRAGDLYSAQLPEKAAIISSRRPLIFRSAKERRKKKNPTD